MNGVQTYERPVHEGVALHFTNPSFFSMNDSPPCHPGVVPSVHAEPIFDCPTDDCAPVDMHMTAKKRDFWKNKKLHDCLYEKPAGDVRTLIRQLKKPEIKKIKRNDIRCSIYICICTSVTIAKRNLASICFLYDLQFI